MDETLLERDMACIDKPEIHPEFSRGRSDDFLEPVTQTMEDITAHDRRTTFLAIRLYHVIYTFAAYRQLGDAVHPRVESKQSVWKTRPSMSSSKIS